MNYKLIKPIIPSYSALEQILTNRGVPHNEINAYLNTTDDDVNSFLYFGEDKLKAAAAALIKCINADAEAEVIVDSDCDGFTSSALLINYLYDLFPAWVNNKLTWFMHTGKQHGLSDFIPRENTKLIIIPDAGSNDYEYHKKYSDKGIDIIILDHHEAEKVSEDAIVINNQLSSYPNKEMSGVGVTWQFCNYLDFLLNKTYATKYLDLVALGMDADMMSLLSIETKHLINKGLSQIKNPFFEVMVEKAAFKMKEPTPIGVAFYVAPFVNAAVRSGTQEEKEIIFQSMLNFRACAKVPSTKRGHKPGEMEAIYVQAARTATNVKNRQTRAQDAGLEFLENQIEAQNLLNNKVLLFKLNVGDIDRNIAGLVANKFMAKYQRPCCILTRVEETQDDNVIVSYQGSARGCDKTGIDNFKEICEATNCIMYAEGHQGAFGLGILEENIDEFIERTNELLADASDEVIYYVDYIYDNVHVNPQHIQDVCRHAELWGKDVDEPFIAVKNLKITKDMIALMSPDKKPTLKITLPNKVSIIKFNSSPEEYESLYSEQGYISIDLVGRYAVNEFCGNRYPQILIEDYEITGRASYIF